MKRRANVTRALDLALIALSFASACKPVDAASVTSGSASAATRAGKTPTPPTFTFAHGVRIYVSAVNCEMNAEDARRINVLARTPGLAVEVVFAGTTPGDTSVVAQARADLGLTVSTRAIRAHELEQFKSIGGAQLPMALLVKGRQLRTIVSGESMPNMMRLVELSLTAIAPAPTHNNSSEE